MGEVSKLFALIIGHAFSDYALQNDFVAKFKARRIEGKYNSWWPWVLTSHALMHGGVVWIVTGNVWLGVAESLAHWIIDLAKCEKFIGFHTDQTLHIVCKVIWSVI